MYKCLLNKDHAMSAYKKLYEKLTFFIVPNSFGTKGLDREESNKLTKEGFVKIMSFKYTVSAIYIFL